MTCIMQYACMLQTLVYISQSKQHLNDHSYLKIFTSEVSKQFFQPFSLVRDVLIFIADMHSFVHIFCD